MLLTLSWLVPLAGALFLLLVGNADGRRDGMIRWITLGVSLATFAVTLGLWVGFDAASADFQFVERYPWIPQFGIDYFVGIDGISLFLVVLTGFLTPVALLSSWGSIERKVKAFSIFISRPRSGDGWSLHIARPVSVLRVLGCDAHPDVFPHWDLGLRPSCVRGHQVHALHDGRKRPDARRDSWPGLPP